MDGAHEEVAHQCDGRIADSVNQLPPTADVAIIDAPDPERVGLRDRIAGAPITWGVCEVPEWGHQLTPERVLGEAAAIGLRAVELGPPGFLPAEPAATRDLLEEYGLRLCAGFLAVVLHRGERLEDSLAQVRASARILAGAGATVLVVAAAAESAGYDEPVAPPAAEWQTLLAGLERARDIGAEYGIDVALHPHYGTLVESAVWVERFLAESDVPLCLDTGHLLVGGAEPLAVVRRAAGRIRHVHLKDVDMELAERVRRRDLGDHTAVARGLYRALGDGAAGIAEIIATLEAAGYSGWYVLEQDAVLGGEPPESEGPMAEAALSFQRIIEVAV
jgi:inosose dehydratase